MGCPILSGGWGIFYVAHFCQMHLLRSKGENKGDRRPSMQEIRCPHCGKVFTVDEASYADIVKQVRDREFAAEIQKQEQMLRRER